MPKSNGKRKEKITENYSQNSNDTFQNLITKDQLNSIEQLYRKLAKDDEFEIMFFNYKLENNAMGLQDFIKVLKYITLRSKTQSLKLEHIISLDICYSQEKESSYRVSIYTLELINKFMEMLHLRKNHVIFSVIVGIHEKEKNISIKKKMRNMHNIIDIDDFDIRIRMFKELPVNKMEIDFLKNLDETTRDYIIFRYKERISLIIEDNDEITIRIDLTSLKMDNDINKLDNVVPTYELEIDLSPKIDNLKRNYLDQIYGEITTLLKVIQQSNYLITKSLTKEIITEYAYLVGLKNDNLTSLDMRKAQSLEVQHVVDQLPNKYAVSDKADGERYFLMIYKNRTYLISDTLNVINTGITNNEKYNNSILDGEYIFIPKYNRFVFLAFDCLFNSGNDIRKVQSFLERLKHVDEIINNNFIHKNQKGFEFKDYVGKVDMLKIIEFHYYQISLFVDALNNDLNIEKRYPLIRRKYFIAPLGAQDNEIFKYSKLIWEKYVYDKTINCPYSLDGLIYHPLEQKYVTSTKESKFVEYKWKPPEKNSIDFYVLFERSTETGKILVLYDNSRDDFVKGKPYKIAHLYVGRLTRTGEQPVLFQQEKNKYIAYLFLQNGEVRDLEGNIVQDGTVVEFYYNNDLNIPDKHRWVPIRTRYEKTESVKRYRKKYGNYVDVANKIWRSIENPVLFSDINILSKDDSYSKHIDILRGKIVHTIIMSEQQENEYYQKTTTLALPMRNFHNWIKSIIIYTYCNPIYEKGKQLSVLDIGVGRGGDIMKFYYSKVDFYVGIDINNNNLISPVNGAISRYNRLRITHPNFPKMYFINADAGAILDYNEQIKIFGNISNINKDLMLKFFSKDKKKRIIFDRINCQFTIHYLLPNNIVWNNFLENINMYLKPGGYMLITTFDADKVVDILGDNDKFTIKYTNTNGEEEILFEIIKKYEKLKKGQIIGPGFPIDVYNALILQENNYITEYLVQKDFIIKEFLEKCSMELIETDTFDNLFNIHEDYFKNVASFEENKKTKKFLMKAAEYYNQKDEVNKASYQITRLNRYYVFRKKDQINNNKIYNKNNL